MNGPVSIEDGDLICVDVTTETVWVEKKDNIQRNKPYTIPKTPTQGNSNGRRRCPIVGDLFKGKDSRDASSVAMSLAYVIAWVADFGISNDTESYLNPGNTYVFKVLQHPS